MELRTLGSCLYDRTGHKRLRPACLRRWYFEFDRPRWAASPNPGAAGSRRSLKVVRRRDAAALRGGRRGGQGAPARVPVAAAAARVAARAARAPGPAPRAPRARARAAGAQAPQEAAPVRAPRAAAMTAPAARRARARPPLAPTPAARDVRARGCV